MVCATPCQRKCAQKFSGAYIFNLAMWCLCSFAPDLDNAFCLPSDAKEQDAPRGISKFSADALLGTTHALLSRPM